MAFADHYPFDAFKTGYQASLSGHGGANAHQEEVFFPAVEAHLLQLRAEGRLGTASGLAGRDVWAATDWNELVVSGTFSRWLVSFITSQLFHGAHCDAEKGSVFDPEWRNPEITPEQWIDRAWKRLCALMDTGTTDHSFRLEIQQDVITGDRCQLSFENWQAKLLRWTGKGFEPAQDMGSIPLAQIEFDCPTGELIITDAINVAEGAFRNAIDLGEHRYDDASLNSDQGCINYSTIVATEYGFAEIATTNTSIAVHREGDRVLVSERWVSEDLCLDDEDGDVAVKGWNKVGTFTCDRWMVDVIDRQIAIDILTRNGISDPAAQLDAWIAEEGDEVVTMRVAPGRYRVRFGPSFSERFDRIEAGVPSGPQPWFIMEPVA